MALAIYLNKSAFSVTVNTMDLTGKLPTTLLIREGDVFIGDTRDPLIVSALASGFIRLVATDPGNFLAGIPAGTSDANLVGSLLAKLTAGPATLEYVSGTGQTAAASATLGTPFTVVVKDSSGTPVSGVTVAWAVTAGGGSLSAYTTTTNGSGQASTTMTLGGVAGANTARASASGGSGALTGSPVTFSATGT